MALSWYGSLKEALAAIDGPGSSVSGERGVGGGCINSCGVLTLSSGRKIFIKRNSAAAADMFRQEAAGLEALGAVSGAPPVPEVLGGGEDGRFSFLLLEYLEAGPRNRNFWEDFGSSLAVLHREARNSACGFDVDNYIGSGPQPNRSMDNWIDFFRIRRIEFQLKIAADHRRLDSSSVKLVQRVMDRMDTLLIPCDPGGASLLHGDLWSGNFIVGPDGKACIIDPAAYYGHREADLAMTRLFGGYERSFYESYDKTWPLEQGFTERCDLYNLYHMLNHLNLFGGSYAGSVISIARQYS
ncbi:MAG: fructosamine kinase family protein [Spirochaetales bacterium]|nr:fructosamine kinase family protein [Spirochaetales bacterium]